MLKGKVVFEVMGTGSKSDGLHPFLILEDGKKVKLALKGDNPFEHNALKTYDGKQVVLEGEFNDNGKFIATEIAEDAPASTEIAEDAKEATEAKELATEISEEPANVGFHAKTFPREKLCVKEIVEEEACAVETVEEKESSEKTIEETMVEEPVEGEAETVEEKENSDEQ